ncbi:embryonic polarity protein dorsal isoform X7 [Bicyclus anynana]|uniref:Embryonic polarity protein dorsal isoform X7 n=1 Tax=Bicyclus anynana TaxID=110368 RepID=A0A6J1N5Z3_BICAN|nr:embryonic polarity protein dorsal isoform X7 [Bicyclus anynana]
MFGTALSLVTDRGVACRLPRSVLSPAPARTTGDALCGILTPSGIILLLQDVDAITRADPLFGAGPMSVEAMPRALPPAPGQPYVRIIEQPAGKALRFRYECEGRSAGSIPGANSTPERRSYPTIEVVGHKGPAIIVVSCVTREAPYKPHPHNLVGREKCDEGVCTVKTTITEENPQVSFSNLGIQCVKRKDIASALKTRERLRVDPFRTGYNHRNQPQGIDLNAVRLCFQVFIQDERTNRVRHSLPPVVSDIIYDKKALSDLIITRVSHCSGYAKGDTEVILLCERVTKEDVMVVFFQKEGERVVWEANANVLMVHRQYAVVFQTPPYRNPHEQSHVQVYLQLKRSSDNARSNAIPFEYIPNHQGADYLKHKRQKTLSSSLMHYEERLAYGGESIKLEPKDKTPPHQSSPRSVFSPTYEPDHVQDQYQQWQMPNISMAGPSHISYNQDMQWGQNFAPMPQLSPSMQGSPNLPSMATTLQPMTNYLQQNTLQPIQSLSPNMQAMSPNMQTMSPNMQAMSPNMQAMSPNMQAMSPNMQMGQVLSPVGCISPLAHGGMSPNMGHVSPTMGHISPNLIQQQQQLPQQDLLEGAGTSDTPSLTGLLMERGEGMQFSGEFSGLSSLLDARGPDLSDSLNRLSTSDLLH